MLCEKCGKNAATIYIKNNINGNITESRVCSQCANEDYKNNMNWLEQNLGGFDLFNALNYGKPSHNVAGKACPLCATSFAQIVQSGRIGCGECYETFKSELEPTVIKMHGRVKHTGKIPKNLNQKISAKRRIEELNIKLKKLIEVQNFEEAALVRDEINSLNQEAI